MESLAFIIAVAAIAYVVILLVRLSDERRAKRERRARDRLQ